MPKKVKIKIVVSVVSAAVIFILAMMFAEFLNIVNTWIPVLNDAYVVFPELYYFFLAACCIMIIFIILLNLLLWFYDKIFKG